MSFRFEEWERVNIASSIFRAITHARKLSGEDRADVVGRVAAYFRIDVTREVAGAELSEILEEVRKSK